MTSHRRCQPACRWTRMTLARSLASEMLDCPICDGSRKGTIAKSIALLLVRMYARTGQAGLLRAVKQGREQR